MKALTLRLMAIAVILMAIPGPSAELKGPIGLGAIFGNPSGISALIATGNRSSVNLIAGYDMNRYDDRYPGNGDCCRTGGILYFSADHVWYNYDLIRVPGIRFPVYFGPGVSWVISHYSSAGVRGVLGVEYQFVDSPFDLFFELAPGINLTPHRVWALDGGLGTRFFF